MKGFWKYTSISICGLLLVSLVGIGLFRAIFVDFVDNYEIGYRYDTFGSHAGQVQLLPRTGYFVTWPFVTKIHHIDGRPFQVCITAIQRTLNCKLVQFDPTGGVPGSDRGLQLLLQWHGRDDYDNSVSVASDGNSSYSTFHQIMMNYAYLDQNELAINNSIRTKGYYQSESYPFLKILPSSSTVVVEPTFVITPGQTK